MLNIPFRSVRPTFTIRQMTSKGKFRKLSTQALFVPKENGTNTTIDNAGPPEMLLDQPSTSIGPCELPDKGMR